MTPAAFGAMVAADIEDTVRITIASGLRPEGWSFAGRSHLPGVPRPKTNYECIACQ
jgi:hypothetical protein